MPGIRLLEPAGEAYRYPLLVKQLLATPWASSDQEVVYRDVLRFTYRELIDRIHRLGGLLRAEGIGEGDTVAMLDWDSHRYLEAYFAVPMLGAVLHTVNVRLAPGDLAYTIRHGGAKLLLVHSDFRSTVEAMRGQLAADVRILPITEDSSLDGYEARLAATTPIDAFPEFDENAIATTFYTSGTTGPPKAVAFSHRQVVLHTLSTAAAMGNAPDGQSFRRGDVYMPLTPMFHAQAWGFPYVATLMGIKQVYPGRYEPDTILTLRAREQVSYSHCVPTVLQMLLTETMRRGERLDGWRMTIGGSSLTPALATAAGAAGATVFAGYGMSETGPNIAISRLPLRISSTNSEAVTILCQAGTPLPLVQARVIDEGGHPLPHDGTSVGELVIRSPWLTQGYAGDPMASEALWAGGWLHTGDAGTIDERGRIALADRMKDLIKSGGEWISSLQLEQLLAGHESVTEVAVIGIPDAHWGERPLAIVVSREGADDGTVAAGLAERMAGFATEGTISRYAIPRVILADALPKTGVGKVDKKALRVAHLTSNDTTP